MRRLLLPAAAVVVLLAWGFGSRLAPAPPVRLDIMVSSAVVLSAAAALVWGMLPLAALGRRLPLVALAALPCAALFVWLGWVPVANIAKIVFAAALGIWIAGELERASWIVLVAAVSAVVDIVSVAAGPTKAILDKGPVIVGWFTVAVTWLGYSYAEAYTGLGVSDVLFFALYLGGGAAVPAARRLERGGDGRVVPRDHRPRHVVDGAAGAAAALRRLPRRERGPAGQGHARRGRGARGAVRRVSRRARSGRPSRCGACAGTCRPAPRW